jgi:integrase/recombinase XerD
MSPPKAAVTTTEIYDQALKYCRDFCLPPGAPQPGYTATWLDENIAVLERYREWLSGGGTSPAVIRTYHIPMAGHALSLNRKPSEELDLEMDFQAAMDYILAKGHGSDWNENCRLSLLKFRRFLLHERGLSECKVTPYEPTPHTQGLPDWLVEELARFQRIRQRNWRPARLEDNIRRFWSGHLRVWRFLVEQCDVRKLADVRRKHLYDYAGYRLSLGRSVSGANADLRDFRSFMIFLQEEEHTVPQALLRIRGLKQPDYLPRALTDKQVWLLRDDFDRRVSQARGSHQVRDAQLDRAVFHLFWQSGLRIGELEELRLEDLDLAGRKLSVRNGKGMKDRNVYMTDTTVHALRAYLAVRGQGPSDHVFLYRNQALKKDLARSRIKDAGKRVGVKVYPHKLRHTTATQLLNAGCPVTSIQKFLGHKKLNTTMVYARAYDATVEADYFAAMGRIEQRLELTPEPEPGSQPLQEGEREQLLALTEQLSEPELSLEGRLEIVFQIRGLLGEPVLVQQVPVNILGVSEWIPPPASVLANSETA